ncbi:hypothetical protein G6F57_022181 [Rhizopus arrhizus]|nr:hypothetical protein G6F57_022181 [Rhizopus arrhizus]
MAPDTASDSDAPLASLPKHSGSTTAAAPCSPNATTAKNATPPSTKHMMPAARMRSYGQRSSNRLASKFAAMMPAVSGRYSQPLCSSLKP